MTHGAYPDVRPPRYTIHPPFRRSAPGFPDSAPGSALREPSNLTSVLSEAAQVIFERRRLRTCFPSACSALRESTEPG